MIVCTQCIPELDTNTHPWFFPKTVLEQGGGSGGGFNLPSVSDPLRAPELLLPNDLRNVKEIRKIQFLNVAFVVAFKIFLAFL